MVDGRRADDVKGISNNSNIVISSDARNPLFVVRKKQILRPLASE